MILTSSRRWRIFSDYGSFWFWKSALINLLGFIDKKFEGTYLFEDREIGDFSDKELSRIRNEAVGLSFRILV